MSYDASLGNQRKAWWEVTTLGDKTHGRWASATLIAVEDEHLHWWITKGEGASQKRGFLVHICEGPIGECKRVDSEDPFAFHTDMVRILELNDFRNRFGALVANRCRSSSSADEKDRKRKKKREPSASPRRRTEEKDAKKRKSRVERGKAMDFEKER